MLSWRAKNKSASFKMGKSFGINSGEIKIYKKNTPVNIRSQFQELS